MDDYAENIAKIIATKTKQIQIQGEKYENELRMEIKKIISIEKEISLIKDNHSISESEKKIIIENKEEEITSCKKNMKKINKDKKEALGCDICIGFTDDHRIKSEYDL
jgi:hypothetical protein